MWPWNRALFASRKLDYLFSVTQLSSRRLEMWSNGLSSFILDLKHSYLLYHEVEITRYTIDMEGESL